MKTKGILYLAIAFILCSCGSSRSVSTDRITVNSFSKIISSSGIDLYYSQSGSNYVEIEKGANVAVEVRDGALFFNRKGRERSSVYVYGNNVESVVLSGNSNFRSDKLKGGKPFNLVASGNSSIRVDKLDTGDCNIALSGNTSCDVKQLKAKKLNLATSGNGNSNINIDKTDNANIASSGNSHATISGKAKNLSVSSSGGATINVTNLKYDNINTHQSGRGTIRK